MVSENGMDKEYREQIIVLNKPSASYRTSSLKVHSVLSLEAEKEAHNKILRNVVVVHLLL